MSNYWCCAVGVFLLAAASCSYGCLPRCYQVNDTTCNETMAARARHEDTREAVVMTMMAPEVIPPGWRAQRDRVIIALLCLKLKSNVTGYCIRETKVTNVSSCSSADVATSCENGMIRCACTSFYMYVYDALADAVLASSPLVTALEDDGSKLALKVAGFEIVSFVAANTAAVPLFNAPLQAWVLVGVGVLVAIVYGTKPLWWDRCLWRPSKGEDSTQEPEAAAALRPPTPEKHQQEEH